MRDDSPAVSRLRRVCLSLPDTTEKPFGGHTSPGFRVRDKLFANVSEDRTSVTLKVPEGVNQVLAGDDPERFFIPRYVGAKGWVGVRLDVAQDWDEIAELVRESYRLIAPKRLSALAAGDGPAR